MAITVVPGREHMLNSVKRDGSATKTIAPATRMIMAISVLNGSQDQHRAHQMPSTAPDFL